jgi:hypothetical protein
LWQPENELHRAALHESGHAVAAYLLGVPIEFLEVATDGGGGLETGLTLGESEARGLSKQGALVALAGPRTEEVLCCGIRSWAGDEDRWWANRHIHQMRDLFDLDAFRDKVEELTRALVNLPGFLDAVHRLASELVALPNERRVLDGPTVVRVIRTVIGDRKVGVDELLLLAKGQEPI